MFYSIPPRVRIALVLMSAFVLSGIIMNYSTSSEEAPPQFQIQHLSTDISRLISSNKDSFLSSFESFRVPSVENVPSPLPTSQAPSGFGWDAAPTSQPETPTIVPTSAPVQLNATSTPVPMQLIPTSIVRVPTIKPLATTAPKPSNTPKPTKIPKPTAFPPINTDTRPGSTIAEIIQEAGLRACVPPALIMAIKTIETGERFKNESAASIKIYNTYGWWKTGAGNPCYGYGYGYHTQTGIVPPDSVSAGTSCSRAVGSPTDIGIMGLMQVSEEEERVTRKYTTTFLPKNIDRRVLFDNILIFAIATKNRIGKVSTPSCTDWSDDAVKVAAEKHHGVCVYDYGTGNAGNYCTKVLSLYKSFK